MSRTIIKTKVRCPKCKGKGVVYDHAAGILSLGACYIMQAFDRNYRDECSDCNGSGYVVDKIEVIE